MVDQNQINELLVARQKIKLAENNFMEQLKKAGYRSLFTGDYDSTRRYKVHPDYYDEAEKNASYSFGLSDWITENNIPDGVVFEL